MLSSSGISKIVLTTFEGNSNLIIKGKIKAFEQKKLGNQSSALVSVEFRVDSSNDNQPILFKKYTQVISSEESSITSVIGAFGVAVNNIYTNFYNDLKEALKM